MENENKCPVAKQVCTEGEMTPTEYAITSDGTVVEAEAIKENPQAFTEVIQ